MINLKYNLILGKNMSEITAPRQTVLVSCRGKTIVMGKEVEKDNIIALDWHMPVSFEPELYAISIGKTRFSLNLIKNSKVFVVNFMPFELKDSVLLCGTRHGEHIDKFKEAGLTKEESAKIDCPRIKEALACLECEVTAETDAGDHVIFIGKVVNSELKKQGKRIFHLTERDFTTTR